VTLNEWIDSVGGAKAAAERLRIRRRTVESWQRFERAPEIGAAANIVFRSGGRVDYNGIYGPIVAKRKEV
jgi:hypothetical protein